MCLQKVKDVELDTLALDIHDIEGVVAVRQKLTKANAVCPRVVGHKRTFGRLSYVKLNSKVRGHRLQFAQRIHTVPNYLHA
jgi:hypothetical protein